MVVVINDRSAEEGERMDVTFTHSPDTAAAKAPYSDPRCAPDWTRKGAPSFHAANVDQRLAEIGLFIGGLCDSIARRGILGDCWRRQHGTRGVP